MYKAMVFYFVNYLQAFIFFKTTQDIHPTQNMKLIKIETE